MSLATDYIVDWADGTYRFALPLRQLEELDDKTHSGPLAILERLYGGSWRLADLREPIRLGLIGGGTSPVKALKLVERYVDSAPLQDSVRLAAAILSAALNGRRASDDDEGNDAAAMSATDPAGSTSPPSDATLQ